MEEGTGTPSSSNNEEGSKKRKGRGPNRIDFNKIAKAKESGIEFNNLGQPVGKTSVPLSTSYGTVATQLIPITYESWLEVPEILKNSVWETTKVRFGLNNDIGKSHILAKMGSCWRGYKSRITKQIRSVPPGPEASRKLQMLKPDNIVDDDEWKKFLKYRLSPEFDVISRRYTALVKKNDCPHTTSHKGLARLREELRAAKLYANEDPEEVDRVETWIAGHKHKDGTPVNECVGVKIKEIEAIQTNQVDASGKTIKDDALAQVLGKENRGRVRGLGFGATPTKVQAAILGRQTTMKLQEEVKDLRQELKELKSFVFHMQARDRATTDGGSHSSSMPQPQYSSDSNRQGNNYKRAKIVESPTKTPTGTSTTEIDASSKKCKLLNWIGGGEVVAEAEIDCIDPQASIHHMILGPNFWRVCVKKIMVSKVPLIRPTSDLQILEDAIGTYIAWPTKYIAY